MDKRRVYTGTRNSGVYARDINANTIFTSIAEISSRLHILNPVTSRYSEIYSILSRNYVIIATVVFVVVLSFLIPDISQKLQSSHELKNLKKVVDKITNEVKQAEVACLAVADEVCCLHCSLQQDSAETSKELRSLSSSTSKSIRTTQSAPVQIDKKIGLFHRLFAPIRNPSRKEITIMSFLYTDSFDAQNHVISTSE